jgi:hypothetical protein
MATKGPAKLTSPGLNSFSNRRRATKPLGHPRLFFSLATNQIPSLLPASSGDPGRFTYRHFASGNFHCFAGLVNPYWGLPEPPPTDSPWHIHTGARLRTPSRPLWGPLVRPLSVAPNNLYPRAPPCRPTERPLFPAAPPGKRKACGFSSRVGVGLFPPYTRWRHRRHPIGRCRRGDVTSGSLIGRHVLSTFLLYTLSHRRRSGWHEPGWLERVLVLLQTLSLSLSLSLSRSLCSPVSLYFFLSRAPRIFPSRVLFRALSLFVWKHDISEECLAKYPQRCSRINPGMKERKFSPSLSLPSSSRNENGKEKFLPRRS